MSISEYNDVTLKKFGGPWLRLDPSEVPQGQALLSLNSEYDIGSVSERFGFSQVWNPSVAINSMANWIFETAGVNANYLVYYDATNGQVQLIRNLNNPIPLELYAQAGAAGISISNSGTFLFTSSFDANGNGIGQCNVTSQYAAGINTDQAFQGPMTTVPTVSDTGTGVVTAGTHRFGYIVKTRNGFTGRISPVLFEVFNPVSHTAPGGQEISLSITATWPTAAATVYPVMTTANNADRYFIVPGQFLNVPGGSSFTTTFTINISDADLSSTGTDVTNNQLLFTQTSAGVAPFAPSVAGIYGPRALYITAIDGIPQAYASEPDNYQYITADQHVLYLPGFKAMSTYFSHGPVCYILGPHWTYAFQDTGDTPVNWPSAQLVDGSIGTLAPRGVSFNASRGFACVADTAGLFIFQGGAYSALPLSHMAEPDWKRINWAAAATVQVLENPDKRQIYVVAPLDGATAPSHILMFDYTEGLDHENVKYSLWNVSYAPGAACITQNPTTSVLELWIGDSAAGAVGRQMNSADTNPYADFSSHAINWQYETALLPGLNARVGSIYHHYASQVRATGSGNLAATIYGIDRTKSTAWASPVTLAGAPGQAYTKRYPRLRSESASYRFTMNTANQHAKLSCLDHYYMPGPAFR